VRMQAVVLTEGDVEAAGAQIPAITHWQCHVGLGDVDALFRYGCRGVG
jgi:hypothetical protein